MGVRCQLRPPDQILAADDCFHPTFSRPVSARQPPHFPQFFAGAGVVPACVCWSVCCVGLSVVFVAGDRWTDGALRFPLQSVSATKCRIMQDGLYCRKDYHSRSLRLCAFYFPRLMLICHVVYRDFPNTCLHSLLFLERFLLVFFVFFFFFFVFPPLLVLKEGFFIHPPLFNLSTFFFFFFIFYFFFFIFLFG